MKNMPRKVFILFVLGIFLSGCAKTQPKPASIAADTWTANVGKVNFMQEGTKITGAMEGYGGVWNKAFEGTITDNKAAFSSEWFGNFALVFEGDTFKSASPDLAFCGVRSSVGTELPAGCGFSGKWTIPAKSVFLDGSYMELKQVGENVTGTIYNGNREIYDTVSGTVYWGKGRMMNGVTEKHGKIELTINTAETGFRIVTDDFPYDQDLCAVREGQASADVGGYYCE